MTARTLFLFAAVLTPMALATGARTTALRFAPAEGSSLTKTFESRQALTLDGITVTGAGPQSPQMEMTMTLHQKVVVTDTYAKNRKTAPQKLVRSFDELGAEQNGTMKQSLMNSSETRDQNMRAKSVLEGKKVVFDWDPDQGEYKKTFDPPQEETDVLAKVQEDMDLRQLLPAGEVDEGDEWDLPMNALKGVFAPGGNLALVPENTDEQSLSTGLQTANMSEMIGDKLGGRARARLSKIEDVGGVSCARIHLDLDVKSTADMTEAARKDMAGSDEAKDIQLDQMKVDFGLVGEGDLLWDIAGGHFRDLDISGQMSIKTEWSMKVEVNGKPVTIEQTMAFSGSTTYSAKAR